MLRIGLTGGIASGKSAVADSFDRRGTPIVDADVIAREVVEPGQPALSEIAETFGAQILDADGRLDRTAMRDQIFSDDQKRRKLESILHPRIKEAMERQVARLTVPYCVLAIPLLIEAHQQDLVDRILVIDVPVELQISRLLQRDRTSKAAAEAILKAQLDRETRLRFADDIIVNNGTLAELDSKVEQLHQKYLALAATAP